jgi:hypothetical protein
MAVAGYFSFIGIYEDLEEARADYHAVKKFRSEAGLLDAYDAAIVEREACCKVMIVRRHETPTRVAGMSRKDLKDAGRIAAEASAA